MEGLVQRRSFNIMGMFDGLDDYLKTGDPVVREWFLVKSNFWPIFLCSAYLLIIKVLGPSFMRDRKPYELRLTMIAYNAFLVLAYLISVVLVIYGIVNTDLSVMCSNTIVSRNDLTYMMATCGWIIYLLKYVEFFDTFFFVLRKKDKLITNLHVIHHTSLPLCGWIFFRTERSGFQAYPVIINSIVHVVMYSYYGLAAVGPSMRKYLWWKRYLTIAQMIQFVLIITFVTVILPVTGCTAAKTSKYINVIAATIFLALFYNFYRHSFKPQSRRTVNGKHANGTAVESASNGEARNGGVANGKSNGESVVANGESKKSN